MNIYTIYEQFTNLTHNFIDKIESNLQGKDPVKLKYIKQCMLSLTNEWQSISNPNVESMKKLLILDQVLELIDKIVNFIKNVDTKSIVVQMGVSDTSKGIIIQMQYDIIDHSNILFSLFREHTNKILSSSSLELNEVEKTLRARISSSSQIGPIISKIARRYVPLMKFETQKEFHTLIMNNCVNKLFDVQFIPIDSSRPIYEQVLTMGQLIPLTQSMSRTTLFNIFDVSYNLGKDLDKNLMHIADKYGFCVIFISKVSKNAIEFNSNTLYDANFIQKNDLALKPFIGLCEKVLYRFNTIKQLSQSKARVPNYFYYEPSKSTTHTIVIESLVNNLFRIVGTKRNNENEKNKDNWKNYLTENEYCQFISKGQSNRASQYNSIMESEILINGHSNLVKNVVNMYTTINKSKKFKENVDTMLSDSMRHKLHLRILEYIRSTYNINTNHVSHIYTLCLQILEDILPTIKNRYVDISIFSMFYVRLFRLARGVASFLVPYRHLLIDPNLDYKEQEKIVFNVLQRANDEDLFDMDETITMIYLRMRRENEIL